MESPAVDEGERRDVRRPMNAFLIFCKRHRSIVREKNPDLDNRSVTRILGDLWAKLKDDEKAMYTDLAKQVGIFFLFFLINVVQDAFISLLGYKTKTDIHISRFVISV